MFLFQFSINCFLFISCLIGMALNRRSLLILLMCIELILLSINLNFCFASFYLDDFYGQIFSLFILTVAAAESAVGIALIIIYFRSRNSILVGQKNLLRF